MRRQKQKAAATSTDDNQIEAWQVWHVYSTYLQRPIASLERAAVSLVASGLCDSVMLNDGTSVWRGEDEEISAGMTSLELSSRRARATITFPRGVPPYALEGLFTAATMRYGELRAFGDDSPVRYLRALTGPCVLEDENGAGLNLYPVIKLYETGVLLVEMRLFSGGSGAKIDVRTFVNDYVQAQSEEYVTAYVPPVIAELAPFVSLDWADASFAERFRRVRAEKQHRRAVEESVTKDSSSEFEYSFCELPGFEGLRESVKSIALLVANTIGYLASKPRTGWRLVLLGQRSLLTTGRWSGRPHVHLLRFAGQTDSAKVNEVRHRSMLASILAGVPDAPVSFMTDNLRRFDDYSVYVTRSSQLWVYTPTSLIAPKETVEDRNYGYVVYEQEAVAELLEYAYALNKRLEDEARSSTSDPRLIGRLRLLLADLASRVDAHVRYGEISDILRRGYGELGIPELQERIAALLAARLEIASYDDERRTTRWALILTIVFGLLAVPPLANDVVDPLWRLLGWWVPSDPSASRLYFTGVATLGVVLAVLITRWMLLTRRP
jgi:hypothetical protein